MFRSDSPSQTAMQVALSRAAHQLFDRPRLMDDAVALPLLGPAGALALLAGGLLHSTPLARQWRAYLVARSRIAEDELALAVRRGVRQYVVLGAGLDTFAYRNPHPAERLRVYEVDWPATQQRKRRLLADARIALPAALRFVPVDFEALGLAQQLVRAGLKAHEPTFFSWLGVSMYLSEAAVRQMLGFVAGMPAGSALVFDYLVPPNSLPVAQRLSAQAVGAMVALAGEPWRSHFEPAAMAHELRVLGCQTVFDMGFEAINQRFFDGRRDGLQVGPLVRVVHLRV